MRIHDMVHFALSLPLAFLLYSSTATGFTFITGHASTIGQSRASLFASSPSPSHPQPTDKGFRTRRQRNASLSSLPSYRGGYTTLFANKNAGSINNGGKTLSTKQILNHEIYLTTSSQLFTPADDEPVPLFSGLRLLIQSLESIILAAAAADSSSSNNNESVLDHLDTTTILRIEQPISAVHSIDPLCWIHAQQRVINNLRRTLFQDDNASRSTTNNNGDNTLPVIYFSDAEGQVEAAALGKASPAHSDSWDPFVGKRIWDNINGNTDAVNGDAAGGAGGGDEDKIPHSMFKESALPPGARVYGGSRFDWQHYHEKKQNDPNKERKSDDRDDWDGFGGDRGGYWILPAVELRREIIVEANTDSEARESMEDPQKNNAGTRTVTLAIHLHNLSPPSSLTQQKQTQNQRHRQGWHDAASHIMTILQELTDQLSPPVPCTTLPPVLTRSESTGKGDDGLAFERGVTEALRQINDDDETLRKVVLARKVDLHLGSSVSGLDILMRMKFGGHIGHLFYLSPGEDKEKNIPLRSDGQIKDREFLGCAPERLFKINRSGHDRMVRSEALAGTRTRGLTPSADNELLRELLSSKKDMLENEITGQFIRNALLELEENGWLEKSKDNLLKSYDYKGNSTQNGDASGHQQRFFVRRLRHLQHICQTFEAKLSKSANVIDVSRSLLRGLHPTPAVCGDSPATALEFIREYETLGFDRGYYAGPFGYIGHDSADVVVAIRSALVTNYHSGSNNAGSSLQQFEPNCQGNEIDSELTESKVSVFGGAGIVDGSTVQGEWTETSHKMGVFSSLFPPSPITLQSYSMPNVAWSTAFIEELVRCGVTQFYICPGSRNTPLTAAIFKSMRSNVGVVRAISVHDERGAGFRAIGYARQNGRPAAVVTSSGTAVANLYPSVVESSSDGVPLLLLTADRPYESRDTGSNQAIDQVKIFSSTYVRWFRDIPPPSDDVPVSLALSDANHAVALSKQLLGPVHLNVQFRENLAPDGGPIRNDNRIGSTTELNNMRFTDAPGFSRWSRSGNRWQDSFYPNNNAGHSIMEVAELIRESRRGIIVTGNLRGAQLDGDGTELLSATISHFSKVIGFPILAGVQGGALRRELNVIPYAEHLLKNPLVSNGMQPDLILQLGTPLISTEISQVIKSNPSVKHVLVQKLHPYERADPEQTITHRISSDIGYFLNNMISHLDRPGSFSSNYGSELAPLLYLGRELQTQFPSIIHEASSNVDLAASSVTNGEVNLNEGISLTEPQITMAISEVLSESSPQLTPMSLFLSNSMPVRDGEFFLYPSKQNPKRFPLSVSVNRGASGIDGIISTATGCGDTCRPTTLVCGDVTTLHDLNALYGLTQDDTSSNNAQPASNINGLPLTTVIVNNGGGAIFSFLPISKHGQDVGFEEYWGTPTKNFSFQLGASAFGLPYKCASSFEAFKDAYRSSIESGGPAVIEAKVVGRSANVEIHQQITHSARSVVDTVLGPPPTRDRVLPVKYHKRSLTTSTTSKKPKTIVLIHGWMGDKSEWDAVGETLSRDLSEEWNIISIDLPGHGDSSLVLSSDQQVAHSSLGLDAMRPFGPTQNSPFSLDVMARAVCHSLIHDHGVEHLDAIAGYSLGGRIALAMKRLYSTSLSSLNKNANDPHTSLLVTDQTRMILLGSSPGRLPDANRSNDDVQRLSKDFSLAESLFSSAYRSYLTSVSQDEETLTIFLTKWYGVKSLWGDLRQRHPQKYQSMMNKRLRSLVGRRQDIASVLYGCSPPLTSQDDWKAAVPSQTIFVAGGLDKKYSSIGRIWEDMRGIAQYIEIGNAGHALLLEEPGKVSSIISSFVKDGAIEKDKNAMDISQQATETSIPTEQEDAAVPLRLHQVSIMEYDAFSISIESNDGSKQGVQGIGWGDSARLGSELKRREGFIISVASRDGMAAGVGEVSPLKGLHKETLEESEHQLKLIKDYFASTIEWPEFDGAEILSLNGSLSKYIDSILESAKILSIAPSVRSGLEMAILSVSSQLYGTLLPQALAAHHWQRPRSMTQSCFGPLPINGLITKGDIVANRGNKEISFQSMKVKVGHRDSTEDALHLIRLKESSLNAKKLRLRADANRAWDISAAQAFINELRMAGNSMFACLEFIEEPLEIQTVEGKWSFGAQVAALEAFANGGGISYALDESLADLAVIYDYDFDRIAHDLRKTFGGEISGQTSCAAFVLKPALLGLELSMQLARLAQQEFQITPVFSSSFDSGIGLSYTAILAAVADNSPYSTSLARFSHGLGTFTMLGGDTLSPPFESYVNKDGLLNVPSLSRALYGLSLDEMSDRLPTYETVSTTEDPPAVASTESDSYLATTSSTSGRDITVSVSLPLPFSDGIASSRFTDLPQMSRWSPWLNSVTYLDESGLTEWNLNIRGVKFSWNAKSELTLTPRGIKWESVSGLKNIGVVEFEPTSIDSCVMKLKMSIIMPIILVSLFQGMPSGVQEFLQNKLLKWSLEMFRDVVKADLALERGDQELGDALFGAVEGRANALEEALK
mmetsp:Transcript_21973/g.47724  ORF Transcript_21973/g.47724 Transcript_21973/m.47724 type:complete len:2506 (-) Transcript_21973:87-7604(-)